MSEFSTYIFRDGTNVGAIVDGQTGGTVNVNQTNYTPEQKPNLADAAAEIQQLLNQLSKTNPPSTPP
ncbi:MAG: hypothetical protein ACKN9K_14275, partial [Dolichospermum sp.]